MTSEATKSIMKLNLKREYIMSSILSKLSSLSKATNGSGRVPMTKDQVDSCKAAIRRDNRGYNVHPNTFDIDQPYRVAINYDGNWANFGNFKSADVAAAVGTIVSAAYFGEKAKAGDFQTSAAETDEQFIAWLADERNSLVIAQANGDAPIVHGNAQTEADPF